ncbi:MAG: putative Ig domain-containing protein [Pseudomonadota bacterium]
MRSLRIGLALAATLVLHGCSSGGGEDTADTGVAGPGPAPVQNRAPSISGTPQSSVIVGQGYSFTPTASDPDGDALTFSIENAPAWITSFDSETGRIGGVPEAGDVGEYSALTITVSDGALTDSMNPFSISVVQTADGSVTLSWQAPTENLDGSPLTDLSGYAFYYGTQSGEYPNRIEVGNPGITSYVIDNLTPDTYYFVATAVKSNGNESAFSNEAIKQVP